MEEKDSQHQSNLRRYQEKRTKMREKEESPENLMKFIRNAQKLIYDQELIEQQKQEVAQQQSELLEKLAARKGRIQEKQALKRTATGIERRKAELLSPAFKRDSFSGAGGEEEDLEQLVAKAKGLIEDQNLISSMQLEVHKQQKELNDRISKRRARVAGKQGEQQDIDKMLLQAKSLL